MVRIGKCPICKFELIDIGYVWCKNCGFECSYLEWRTGRYKDLKTTKDAQERFKKGKTLYFLRLGYDFKYTMR